MLFFNHLSWNGGKYHKPYYMRTEPRAYQIKCWYMPAVIVRKLNYIRAPTDSLLAIRNTLSVRKLLSLNKIFITTMDTRYRQHFFCNESIIEFCRISPQLYLVSQYRQLLLPLYLQYTINYELRSTDL